MTEPGYENCWFCPECETTDRKFFDFGRSRGVSDVHCDDCGTPAQNVGDTISHLRHMAAEANDYHVHALARASRIAVIVRELRETKGTVWLDDKLEEIERLARNV